MNINKSKITIEEIHFSSSDRSLIRRSYKKIESLLNKIEEEIPEFNTVSQISFEKHKRGVQIIVAMSHDSVIEDGGVLPDIFAIQVLSFYSKEEIKSQFEILTINIIELVEYCGNKI